jgi:subtilisin family serine protease|tara:strand:+ start:2038 stop:3249 length:1212 start_codon:yes stop_codon:yes gene_type:complete
MKQEVKLPDFKVEEISTTFSQSFDWSLKYANIPNTWKVTQGEGMTIAVIDTGMPDHVDIGDNAVAGANLVDGEDIYDYNGHQTHCVGIICAKNNNQGFVGVAPKAKSVCFKALNKNGSGSYSQIAKALEAVKELRPDVVSMSLGGSTPSVAMHEFIKDLYAMNIPVVCAAGNSGFAGVGYPAAFPETIAVGAFDQYGKIAGFSSRGSQVDWAAPGANIYSTYLKNSYASLSGTSMACPFMAAIIALMISKHRKQEKETGKNDCKTVEDIRQHLLKYTNDKGNVGKDNDWGYGVVDIEKLITGESSKPTTTTLKPTTTTLKPTTTTFKPTTTTPKPKTEPPSSTPPPKKESSFVKKNIAWIVAGVFALVCLGIVIYQYAEEEYEPVDWGIDWDERYNNDPARPR